MLITPNFSTDEMACSCCGKSDMDEDFMRMLQALREEAGFAFRGPLWIGLREVGSRSIGGVFYQLT